MPTNEKYYELQLLDPATPAFVTIPKPYIGDKESLLAVADELEKEDHFRDTVNAMRAYFAGKTDAMHTMAFQQIPILREVNVLDKSELVLEAREWDHMNVWNCPYHMRLQYAHVSQILISANGIYHRFMRARISDFGYKGVGDEWLPIGDFIMGNAAVIEMQGRGAECEFSNRLHVFEDSSGSLEKQKRKMQDPNAVIFDEICNEVFGDG